MLIGLVLLRGDKQIMKPYLLEVKKQQKKQNKKKTTKSVSLNGYMHPMIHDALSQINLKSPSYTT